VCRCRGSLVHDPDQPVPSLIKLVKVDEFLSPISLQLSFVTGGWWVTLSHRRSRRGLDLSYAKLFRVCPLFGLNNSDMSGRDYDAERAGQSTAPQSKSFQVRRGKSEHQNHNGNGERKRDAVERRRTASLVDVTHLSRAAEQSLGEDAAQDGGEEDIMQTIMAGPYAQAAAVAAKECRRDSKIAWGQPEKAIRYTYNEKTEEWDMRRVYIVSHLFLLLMLLLLPIMSRIMLQTHAILRYPYLYIIIMEG